VPTVSTTGNVTTNLLQDGILAPQEDSEIDIIIADESANADSAVHKLKGMSTKKLSTELGVPVEDLKEETWAPTRAPTPAPTPPTPAPTSYPTPSPTPPTMAPTSYPTTEWEEPKAPFPTGPVVGGVAAVALAGFLFWWNCWR